MQETQVQSLGWEYPGGENGNPFQYSCLENPTDRGAWRTAIHGLQRVGYNWECEQDTYLYALVFSYIPFPYFTVISRRVGCFVNCMCSNVKNSKWIKKWVYEPTQPNGPMMDLWEDGILRRDTLSSSTLSGLFNCYFVAGLPGAHKNRPLGTNLLFTERQVHLIGWKRPFRLPTLLIVKIYQREDGVIRCPPWKWRGTVWEKTGHKDSLAEKSQLCGLGNSST